MKAAGAEEVAVVCVNDPYVMSAWAKDMKTEGKVHMLADPRCEFSRDLGCVQDDTATLGGMRSRRYSMVRRVGEPHAWLLCRRPHAHTAVPDRMCDAYRSCTTTLCDS